MSLQEQLDALDALLDDRAVQAANGAVFNGRRLSLAELSALRRDVDKKLKAEQAAQRKAEAEERLAATRERVSAQKTAKEKRRQVNFAISALNRAKDSLDGALNSGKNIDEAQRGFLQAVENLRAIDPQNANLPATTERVSPATPAFDRGAAVPAPPGARAGQRTATEITPAVTPTATPAVTPTVPSTPSGTTAGGAGVPVRRRARKEVSMDQVAEAIQQFFPNYTAEWLSENGVAHFGQDLIDLFRRVAAPGSTFDLTTTEGQERVRAEIRKTVYWQTTLTAAKNFDQLAEVDRVNTLERTKQRLTQTYGNIGLDNTTLNELALNVARNNLTGIGEQQAVYNTVFRTAEARPSQAQRALEGIDADRIRSLGRAYNFDVTNEQIQSILTGTPERTTGLVLTEDGLRERMQKAVKGAMPQLAEQIDAGLTLEDISRNYKRYAASLLEKSEDEIDMFQGPYLDAFGNREQGQLSLGEWTQKVKSDPRFGWQFTNQANRQASDIALTIARAFGKVQ